MYYRAGAGSALRVRDCRAGAPSLTGRRGLSSVVVSVHKPHLVLHYERRASGFYEAARDLEVLGEAKYFAAIGLLAVHGCIALADAVLVAVEGNRGCGEDHAEVARRLRSWCSARRVDAQGIKHLEWLLSKKSHFSYAEATVTDEELQRSKLKMDQFFGWAFRTFPAVAQLPNDA